MIRSYVNTKYILDNFTQSSEITDIIQHPIENDVSSVVNNDISNDAEVLFKLAPELSLKIPLEVAQTVESFPEDASKSFLIDNDSEVVSIQAKKFASENPILIVL